MNWIETRQERLRLAEKVVERVRMVDRATKEPTTDPEWLKLLVRHRDWEDLRADLEAYDRHVDRKGSA